MYYEWFGEHKRSFNLKDRVSHYANYRIDENHSFDKKIELIDSRQKGREQDFCAIVAINKHKNFNNLLNSQLDFNNRPLLNLFIKTNDGFERMTGS